MDASRPWRDRAMHGTAAVTDEDGSIAEELLDLTAALATERRLETLLAGVNSAARLITGAEVARIFLLDRVGRELHCVQSLHGGESDRAAARTIQLFKPDGGYNLTDPSAFAVITGRLVDIPNVYAYSGYEFGPVYEDDRDSGRRTVSFAALALRNADAATLGVLQLVNARAADGGELGPLSPQRRRALQALAAHAAAAIANARMFEENRQLIRQLDRANAELAEENTELRTVVSATTAGTTVIGDSPAIRLSLDLARRAAGSRVPVLLLGETGTGKEVFARLVHASSPRTARPMIAQNCASLPEALLESELFGHRRGAFSGAIADKKGLVQEAAGGTLFLDEIGDMPIGLQSKILRLLEDGEVRRVGDTRSEKIDVRVIAATNCDLKRKIADGSFREDLFYRLSVFPITLPPLRERPSDIVQFAEAFLARAAQQSGRPTPALTPRALDALMRWRFPGNVRELKNIIERAVLMVDEGERVDLSHLPAELAGHITYLPLAAAGEGETGSLRASVERFEATLIEAKLREVGGNQTRTAELLDISRRSLVEKLRRYGIRSRPPSRSLAPGGGMRRA
jgi:sigma-54-dependent transcriptional regulator